MNIFESGYTKEREAKTAIRGVNDLPTGFGDNVGLAARQFINEDLSISAEMNHLELEKERHQKIMSTIEDAKEQGAVAGQFMAYQMQPWKLRNQVYGLVKSGEIEGDEWSNFRFRHKPLVEYAKRVISLEGEEVKGNDAFQAEINQRLSKDREEANQVFARADGWGIAGQFVGGMGGAMSDPINLLSLGGGAFVSTARSSNVLYNTLNFAGREAVIGAASEAAIQVPVSQYKKQIGVEYGVEDAVKNVALAGAGAFVFAGVLNMGGQGLRVLRAKVSSGIESGEIKATPEIKAALKDLEKDIPFVEAAPTRSPKAHIDNAAEVADVVEDMIPREYEPPPVRSTSSEQLKEDFGDFDDEALFQQFNEIDDVKIPQAFDDEGNVSEFISSKQALKEIDDEIAGLEAINTCMVTP